MTEQSDEAMLTYYKRLFPYDPYYKWLTYGNGNFPYASSIMTK